MKHRVWLSTSLVVAASLLTAPAVAQDAERSVAYRQGIMKALQWHIAPIAAMAKGESTLDSASLQHHAEALAALATIALEGFPDSAAGAGKTQDGAVLSNATFATRAQALVDTTQALAAGAAGAGDQAAIGALLGPIGGACKDCHDSFRTR